MWYMWKEGGNGWVDECMDLENKFQEVEYRVLISDLVGSEKKDILSHYFDSEIVSYFNISPAEWVLWILKIIISRVGLFFLS